MKFFKPPESLKRKKLIAQNMTTIVTTNTETRNKFKRNVSHLPKLFLTLILLTWKIWGAANNVSSWQMGFNSAFKRLILIQKIFWLFELVLQCVVSVCEGVLVICVLVFTVFCIICTVFCIVSFMYIYSYLFYLHYCKD